MIASAPKSKENKARILPSIISQRANHRVGIRGGVRTREDRLGRTQRHQIVPAGQAEIGDIGYEDAQQSNATEHVHTCEALLTLDRGKSRRRACNLFLEHGSAVALHGNGIHPKRQLCISCL